MIFSTINLGIEEQMVIKLNQGEKVKKTTLSAKVCQCEKHIKCSLSYDFNFILFVIWNY